MRYQRFWSTVLLVLFTLSTLHAQRLYWLGLLSKEDGHCAARDVSNNGVVVGYVGYIKPYVRAFRWTVNDGMQPLPTLGGEYSQALAISADGSVIVGWANDSNKKQHAVRWLSNGTVQSLLNGIDFIKAEATDVSADGSVIVGWVLQQNLQTRAFRWSESEGLTLLDLGPESNWSYAYGCSSDGSKIVGKAEFNVAEVAFLHTPDSVYVLGTLTESTGSKSTALAVSDVGNVVVGWSFTANFGTHAFRWTPENGMEDLTPETDDGRAYDVSADGQVIVGGLRQTSYKAFRWTPDRGLEILDSVYNSLLPLNASLKQANAISPNGRYIAGIGFHPDSSGLRAFLLDTRGTTEVGKYSEAFSQFTPWPNPFAASVHIPIYLPSSTLVKLKVYDLLGYTVRVLVNRPMGKGMHLFVWDGRDEKGNLVPPGIYILRLETGNRVQSVNIVRLK